MITVLAEKIDAAREMARVMGGVTKDGDGYIEGNGFIFTWARGHFVQLALPQAYGFEWKREHLPMLPEQFKLIIKQIKDSKDSRVTKNDPYVAKQLKVIKACFDRCTEIIAATDAEREGELIFRYIYEYLGCKKPFRRLWIQSLMDNEIKKGFASLKKGSDYDNKYEAAKSRSQSDWLVGMNASQALSLAVGNGVYSLGRVQTPTLVMICKRYLENKEFKPEIFHRLEIDLEKDGVKFTATSSERWETKDEAESKLKLVKNLAIVEKVTQKEKSEDVPLLFDLTSLQVEANKKFGYSAQKTLDLAQQLYERKLITYPRTGSRYIGDDVFDVIPALIKLFTAYQSFSAAAKFLVDKPLNKRSVDVTKVKDHHALLPTENLPSSMNDEEKNIYDFIVGRMFESFHESCIKQLTTIELESGVIFLARGTVIKYAGWRNVRNEQEEKEEGESYKLPVLTKGERVPVLGSRNVQKQTKPKSIHTDASILEAMQTCGREIEDEAAREAMKKGGLGTDATRANIIETLLKRSYIERQKKYLIPTHKGLSVYELVKDKSIGQPILTGDWENMLTRIDNGTYQSAEFMSGIREYTNKLTNELLASGSGARVFQESAETANTPLCPKCKKCHVKFVKNDKLDALVCTDRTCGFIVFRSIAKKKLTDTQITMLVEKSKTGLIKGFMSTKSGKEFEAMLKLDDSFKVVFDFQKK